MKAVEVDAEGRVRGDFCIAVEVSIEGEKVEVSLSLGQKALDCLWEGFHYTIHGSLAPVILLLRKRNLVVRGRKKT